ncbi:MAG TPA: hypothetical protein VEC18_07620, partial [Myxococcota bacterium]|nr:hypothetical protein [Myxococcota bacterium]
DLQRAAIDEPAERAAEAPFSDEMPRGARREGRRRRRGQRGGAGREAREAADARGPFARGGATEDRAEPEAGAQRYEELSIFDLDDAPEAEAGGPRSRRGRRRGRRSRSGGSDTAPGREGSGARSDAPARDAFDGDEASRPPRPHAKPGGAPRDAGRSLRGARLDEDDADEDIADLLPTVSDVDEPSLEAPLAYEEDADALGIADAETPAASAEPTGDAGGGASESILRRARRRAAFVVHADRRSLIAALLLARDLRLIEGIWVYPQSELMTFFRSVATDLHEQTPICVIGFTASPARDTIQAASLYSDRLAWFDHHDWPPEDLESLRGAIGEANVVVRPGAESSIPAVLTQRNRRSRFSDKIVELATGRFSQHDYERWGRIWWERLGAAAAKPGERRADIEPLIVGRPSDLAREAADAATPPPPPEVEFVAGRDFRLVHFGGYQMVVVPTPPDLDMHLAARIARERYGSQLSIAGYEGDSIFVLAADEIPARRNLDLAAMVSHLASKHDWIEATTSEDHVARIRIRDFATHPERLNDVIGEIAMGRSILEG